MVVTFRRLDLKTNLEYVFDLYLKNREFFRRVAPDLRKEDILNIESIIQGTFYLVQDENQNKLGITFLTRVDNSGLSCHLGVLLEEHYQDRKINEIKIAFHVTRQFISYIFSHTHLRKISMCFLKKRIDIERSLIKGGFHKEAQYRESVYFEGKFQDEIEYALFKDDFIKLYGS